MSKKVTEQDLRSILHEIGINWTLEWDEWREENDEDFSLLPVGVLGEMFQRIENRQEAIRRQMYSMQESHNRLLRYLGIQEVTHPESTELIKVSKKGAKRVIKQSNNKKSSN